MEKNQDHFNVLRVVKKPNSSQRELAKTLDLAVN